jgi:hypothetical protein
MWKLKEKFNTKDYVFFDPNELSEENKTIIMEKYPDLFDEHFKIIWNGLMNLRPETTNEAVNYTEYTNNDSENDSVYITAVANN